MLSIPNQIQTKKGMTPNKVLFASISGTSKIDIEEDPILEPSIQLEIRQSLDAQTTKQSSWRGNPLIILYYVSKFIRQLKNSASQIKFRFITERILNFIHDQASDSQQLFYKKQGKQYDYFKYLRDLLPVIEPDSWPKLIWDIVVLLAVLLSLFYVPIYLSFDVQVDVGGTILFDILPAYFLLFDVFINCMTAYYSKGVIHRDNILKHYARTNLISDLIIVIPALLSSFGITYIRFLLLLRVFRVQRMIESIEEIINLKEKYANIFQLIKLGFFVLLICHFCACIWAYIGEYELQQGYDSWIIQYHLVGKDWKSIYITSLYFSVITTLTIGYGDIAPQTDAERVYVILVALLVCGVLAYSISTIGSIFKSMAEKKSIFKTKMKILVRYMRARKLSPHIQLQVKKFYEHFANQESESNIQAEEMMTQLTKNLKEKIAIDIYYQTLKKSRLLQNMCDQCLKQLCLQVKEAKCVPEDILFTRNELVSKLVFVLKGELCLIANDQVISSYKSGVVGEREFIIQGSFPTQLQASHFCQIAYINHEDFINVIKDHNEDHQKFSMIRDNLIFNESYKNFGQVCEVCNWTHQMIKCPYVFVSINKSKVLRQSNQSFDQFRLYFERSLKKQQSLAQKSDLQECALALIMNENLISSEELNDQLLQELGFSIESQLNRTSTLTQQGSSVVVHAGNEKETKRQFSNNTNKSQSLHTVDLFFRNNSLSDQQAIQQPHDKSQFYKRSIIHSPDRDKMRSSSGDSIVSSSLSQKKKVSFQNNVENPIQQIRQTNNSSTVNVRGDQNSFLINYFNAKMESQKSINHLNQARHSTLLSNTSQAQQQQRLPNFKRVGYKKFSQKAEQQQQSSDMVQEIEEDLLQNKHNIIESLDIDRQFKSTIYYPLFNLDNIINKMKQFQQGSIIPQSNFISGFRRSKTQRLKN